MNNYLETHMPDTAETVRVAYAAVLDAAGELGKAEAAMKRAEAAWRAAQAAAVEATCAHFAANNPPSGVVVSAEMLARLAAAINTPALEWDSDARRFRETVSAEGAAGTVATAHRDGRLVLLVRLYRVCMVSTSRHSEPGWSRVATLEIWAHSGTIAGSGGRKRVVSEEDVQALMALEVTT